MKLVMASSGFTNKAIINALVELVGKKRNKINFAILNEAIKGEPGDHRWFYDALKELMEAFPGGMEFVDLQAHSMKEVEERLNEADVIFCFGGNTDYLANVFAETGFSKILPKLLEEKVWVGSSAGSCVLGHKKSEEFQTEIYQEKPTAKKFLELVPVEFLPHYRGVCYDDDVFTREVIIEESTRTNFPVYALTDEAALVVEGEGKELSCHMVGRGYLIAQNGMVLDENKQPKFSVSFEIGS